MTDLERRQKAGQEVENKVREALLNFYPAHELKVSDVLYIAGAARRIAFDAFDPDYRPET